ncbi:MAG: glutathione S-transferase family protein [Gammaproteobacteria bacterium]
MIDFYTYGTPNGRRVAVMLEETGLEYCLHKIDLPAEEQYRSGYLQINPTGRIPAIVDREADGGPLVLNQSAAILLYLAEKTACLLPVNPVAKSCTLEWLFFHATDMAPTGFDIFYLTSRITPAYPKAAAALRQRLFDLYRHFDERLATCDYLAGDSYSIADIAALPAVAVGQDALFERYRHLQRWHDMLLERPAVQRGLRIPE